MKLYLFLLLLLTSCKDPLSNYKSTVYYQLAVDRLKQNGIDQFRMLTREEMEAKNFIHFWNDTLNLRLSTKLFALKDKASGRIFIFSFYTNRGFIMYVCDEKWKVKSKFVQTGEGVYEDDDIPLPK
jgi:hypothetical protein